MNLLFRLREFSLFALVALGLQPPTRAAGESDIRWLLEYDGRSLPSPSVWHAEGQPEASTTEAGLRLIDSTDADSGSYRATWAAEAGTEVIVEARLRVAKTFGVVKAKPDSVTAWPWRDGAPVGLLVSDGRHQEGLVFLADRLTTWTDRFLLQDTKTDFHTYRLVIRGTDMSVAVDGEAKLAGENAFWKPAPGAEPFLQFGSNSKAARGEAEWQSVRFGVRKITTPPAIAPLRVTMSEPWLLPRPDLKTKPTRPYVYNLGGGRLLMSQAQGPDASFEPYGVLLSTDEGKTWSPIKELDQSESAPLPMLALRDGSVFGMSRWTWEQPDGSRRGRTVHWDAGLTNLSQFESRLQLPPAYRTTKIPYICERHVFEEGDGSLLMAGYSKTGPSTPDGLRAGRRYSHLLRSTDGGHSWEPYAVMGAGGEPAVAYTGGSRMTALLRTGPFKPLGQTFSEDNGQTWSPLTYIEVGSVCPDLVLMSNGLLACSYGRPANSLMFSADGGRTWISHHVITDKTGFNYSGLVEVRPGRLLYLHDAGGLQALYIDVERTKTP